MRAIAVAYLCCILLSGCAASVARGPETYVVRSQDTLYSIAWRHDLDYRDLARWNHLGPDYRLAIGQVLTMSGTHEAPVAGAPAPPRPPPLASRPPQGRAAAPYDPAPGNNVPPANNSSAVTPPAAAVRTPPPNKPAPVGGGAGITGGGTGSKWIWPTAHATAPRPVPGGGILLFGKLGQDVRAASAGRVVYSGNGIRGYGNLIIIKHGDTLLSSYAHNQESLVREGQEVNIGQTIAHMGTGPHQVSVLYFEIRANGRPVDPIPYLPSR